jgi:hypothetical protein
MKTSHTLIAAAVAALIAGGASAGDQYGNKDKSSKAGSTFSTLDTDRDGRISRTEASSDTTIDFATADANGDGYLSNAEFKKAAKASHDSSMPTQPQSDPVPGTDPAGQPDATSPEPTAPQDQSVPAPSDTETPRQ